MIPLETNAIISSVMAQREEILRAFIAKYGFSPEEAEQVIQIDGEKITWKIRRTLTQQETPCPNPNPTAAPS